MKRRFFWIIFPLALASCRGESDQIEPDSAENVAEVPAPPAPPQTDPAPAAPAGGARQVVEQTDTFLFEYSYPQPAGDEPELAIWLDRRLDERRNALALDATRGRDEALDRGFPFNIYSSDTAWEVVADLPGWLSMSADFSTYTGGAHPNYGFDTIVWDKARNAALEPIAFFISPESLDEALGQQLCERLNAERAKRRGQPVPENSDSVFDACVKVDETNLLLGSVGNEHFDRIGIQIAPYLAGPYAEGSYEFIFPVTGKLLKIVRPRYQDAFTARN